MKPTAPWFENHYLQHSPHKAVPLWLRSDLHPNHSLISLMRLLKCCHSVSLTANLAPSSKALLRVTNHYVINERQPHLFGGQGENDCNKTAWTDKAEFILCWFRAGALIFVFLPLINVRLQCLLSKTQHKIQTDWQQKWPAPLNCKPILHWMNASKTWTLHSPLCVKQHREGWLSSSPQREKELIKDNITFPSNNKANALCHPSL